MEKTGGSYACLVGYIKDYSIWHPCRDQGSSVLGKIIWGGTETVTGHLKRLRNTLTTDLELEELSINLATDSAALILEFTDFFTSKYEEYIDTSTFPPEQALNTILYLTALMFEELHGVCAEAMDTVQHVPGMFFGGFIKDR